MNGVFSRPFASFVHALTFYVWFSSNNWLTASCVSFRYQGDALSSDMIMTKNNTTTVSTRRFKIVVEQECFVIKSNLFKRKSVVTLMKIIESITITFIDFAHWVIKSISKLKKYSPSNSDRIMLRYNKSVMKKLYLKLWNYAMDILTS